MSAAAADRAELAKLGALLMSGRSMNAAAQVPRTMPAPVREDAPLFERPSGPPITITAPTQTAFTTSSSTTTAPTLTERDTNIQDAATGPSLQGNKEALAVSNTSLSSTAVTDTQAQSAREFHQTATRGETRAPRSKYAARDLQAAGATSTSIPRVTERPISRAPPTSPLSGTSSAWENFSGLHSRPSSTPSSTVPQASLLSPVATTKPVVHAPTATILTAAAASTTPAASATTVEETQDKAKAGSTEKSLSLHDRQIAQVNSVLNGSKTVPPHLRTRVAVPTATQPAVEAATTTQQQIAKAGVAENAAQVVSSSAATSTPTLSSKPTGVQQKAEGIAVDPIVVKGSPAKPSTADTPSSTANKLEKLPNELDDGMDSLSYTKREGLALAQKVTELESKVALLWSAHVRRENASEPYKVVVVLGMCTTRLLNNDTNEITQPTAKRVRSRSLRRPP